MNVFYIAFENAKILQNQDKTRIFAIFFAFFIFECTKRLQSMFKSARNVLNGLKWTQLRGG